eukprot:5290105-Pyramimonas_sp.AAC.2
MENKSNRSTNDDATDSMRKRLELTLEANWHPKLSSVLSGTTHHSVDFTSTVWVPLPLLWVPRPLFGGPRPLRGALCYVRLRCLGPLLFLATD